jgi:hypothetical protein
MIISVTKPIGRSLDWTRHILFAQFSLGKWFTLGFCAFLAGLGEGGTPGFSLNLDGLTHILGADGFPLDSVINFILDHLVATVIVASMIFFFGLALWALLLWLSSRGKFMFLEGIIRNRIMVSQSWSEYRSMGDSLFQFRFYLTLITVAVMLCLVGLALLIGWPDIRAKQLGINGVLVLAFGIPTALTLSLAFLVIHQVLNDFVVPIMYRTGGGTLDALRLFRQQVLSNHLWPFILFYLMKLAIVCAVLLMILVSGCLTCCIMYVVIAVPYLGSVALLPVSVFFRCYPIFFLEQFGEHWRFLSTTDRGINLPPR